MKDAPRFALRRWVMAQPPAASGAGVAGAGDLAACGDLLEGAFDAGVFVGVAAAASADVG